MLKQIFLIKFLNNFTAKHGETLKYVFPKEINIYVITLDIRIRTLLSIRNGKSSILFYVTSCHLYLWKPEIYPEICSDTDSKNL